MLQEPNPELDELLERIGNTGHHPANINASAGTAGNILVRLRWQRKTIIKLPDDVRSICSAFNLKQTIFQRRS